LSETFSTKFRLAELALREYAHWIVSLRPEQPTLGALVISLTRPCEHLGQLTGPEAAELSTVFADVESHLERTYRPDKLNYLALMMVDAQVHLHVIPRYEGAREVGGRTFDDPAWPGPPVLAALPLTTDDLEEVRATLAGAWG
jgi:diadenosine tetraphosphate (Ap4A) HIT family hydrolase